MKHNSFSSWCQQATAKIRYGPDRQAVSHELMAHLEDHRDSLIEHGMDEAAATQEALKAMGNPEEIAPQLAAIHRPFWGYMESITRVLAILMTIFVIFFSLIGRYSFGMPWDHNSERDNFTIMEQTHNPLVDVEQNVSASLEPFTYTVTRVAVYPFQIEYSECLIRLDVAGDGIFCTGHKPINYFWATDNLGNLYYSDSHSYAGDSQIQVLSPQVYLFHSTYELIIRNFDRNATQWIELHYERDGREAVLHIDLTGGGT